MVTTVMKPSPASDIEWQCTEAAPPQTPIFATESRAALRDRLKMVDIICSQMPNAAGILRGCAGEPLALPGLGAAECGNCLERFYPGG
jgi:hypothetical protein